MGIEEREEKADDMDHRREVTTRETTRRRNQMAPSYNIQRSHAQRLWKNKEHNID